jgi:PAS domain S-box-containing protein
MRNPLADLFKPGETAIGIISLVGLLAISRYSYPAFHTLAELFSIVIGFSLFLLIWNSRRIIDNNYLVLLGIAYLFIASMDLIHTLAYKGMDFFSGYGTNLPTQLWIASRYLESFSLLAALFFIGRKLRSGLTLTVYALLTSILLACIFGGIFPDCHIEGIGLTRFKVVSEYLISAILLCSLVLLLKRRDELDRDVFLLIACSIIFAICSELAFTIYLGVFDISNLIGHLFKIISFYLIYKAVIETGLSKPYLLLFRNLKQQEEALRESEERYRSLFEHMSEGFALHEMLYDERGEPCDYRFLDVNPAFEMLTGLQREQILGKLMTDVLPGEDPKWIKLYGDVTMTGVPIHFDRYSPVLKRHYDVFAYRPAPRRFAVIFMDVTDRKRAEIERRKQTALLEEAYKEMESFGYSISHDLRAPLRAIDGYSRMILKRKADEFDEDTGRQFGLIRENTRMMGQLIDDLLAFSRLGKQAVAVSEIHMDRLFREIWEELQMVDPGRRANLKMDQLPHGIGDYALIKQVITNLLANAIKFTRGRDIAMIEVGSFEDDGQRVYFVRDNGVGFDMQYYDKLFAVFQRLHHSNDFEGTGVGLAIVQRIIQRHGGRVWAEGDVEKGATFYFTLPRTA